MRTHTRRWAMPLAAVVAAALLVTPPGQATPLATGKVTTDFAGGTDTARAVAIQPDGKIVVAGGGNNLFKLARYNANGSLDTTFGQGGRVTTMLVGLGMQPGASAFAVTVQADGRILASGSQWCCSSSLLRSQSALVRYNANGSLDATFGGGDGIVTVFQSAEVLSSAQSLLLAGGGRIVTVGHISSRFALARFTADGALDPTFDGDGTTIASPNNWWANASAQQADGRVVGAGGAITGPGGSVAVDFALARYDQNGALDPTFGTGGLVSTNFAGALDEARALLRRPDGRLVTGGVATVGGGTDFALARYGQNGALEGTVTTDFGNTQDEGNGAVLQPDGRVVLAGFAGADFALARYNADGSLDATFGQGGRVRTDFAGTVDRGFAVALQPDGRIVVVGSVAADFGLARYNANGSLDATFG